MEREKRKIRVLTGLMIGSDQKIEGEREKNERKIYLLVSHSFFFFFLFVCLSLPQNNILRKIFSKYILYIYTYIYTFHIVIFPIKLNNI